MTLAVGLIILGTLLIYAGIKGLSVIKLLTGRIEPSTKPEAAR